ncbi:NAD(P)/FAD-dependent oxidoreductase [Streptomyces sp. NPDC057654]|uniref:NAD(P)/FAD-dependent oxidoreductase n=1 Tax=Streptomyces sp. NPDC057654 TaxID=3346196 RepID=UPI0036CB70E4
MNTPDTPDTPDRAMRRPQDGDLRDVAVLGGSLPAATLATVLAAGGARVTLIDDGRPPAFPPGEMGVHAAGLFRVLAERYKTPELARPATVKDIHAHITRTVGAEHCHSFVYHREGRPQDPAELLQVCPPKGAPPEPHFHRPDIDAYLLRCARGRGADVREGAKVSGATAGPDGAVVRLSDGAEIRARYLVDASGPDSPLVSGLGLREEPVRLATASRTLATHMTRIRPFADVVADRAAAYRPPTPWHRGSMHHLTDGAYLAVLPLGNHPDSTGGLFSVSLTLDARRFPAREGTGGLSAEEEFRAFVARFPTLADQFAYAIAGRPWLSTERNQYAARRTAGERWCLIGDAAGYVDPFISRGLGLSLETVNVLARRLLDAVRDGDFSAERFAVVGELTCDHLAANDELAAMVHASLRDPALVRAVLFVLEVGFRFGGFPMLTALTELRATGSDAALRALETVPYRGHVFAGHEGYHRLFTAAGATCAAVAAGELDARTASERIFRSVRDAEFVPAAFKLGDPAVRSLRITPVTLLRLALWTVRGAPKDIAPLVRAGIKSVLRGR